MKAGNAARLVSVCLACVKPWVQSLAPHKTKAVAQVCNPKPSVVKTSESEVQGYPGLHSVSEAGLRHKNILSIKYHSCASASSCGSLMVLCYLRFHHVHAAQPLNLISAHCSQCL